MGKLKAFEVQSIMEYEEDHPSQSSTEAKATEKKVIKEEKSIAFKTSKSGRQMKITIDSEDSSEEEIALLANNFKKFLKYNKRTTGSPWGNKRMKDGEEIVRCFHCDEKGHYKANCPHLKNEKGKGKEVDKGKQYYKHGNKAEWGHSEDEISSSDDEVAKPICFMARDNDKVVPPPVYTENFRVDYDWFEDYAEALDYMNHLSTDMAKQLKASKKQINSLEDDKEFFSQALTTEKRKNNERSPKLNEPKEVVTVVDTILVDKLNW